MFCLRIPKGELKGLFLMDTKGEFPIFRNTLDELHTEYVDFWGFEMVEVDCLENRAIIRSYGIISKTEEFEDN